MQLSERSLSNEARGLPWAREPFCLLTLRACFNESNNFSAYFARGESPATVLKAENSAVGGEYSEVSGVRVVYTPELFENAEVRHIVRRRLDDYHRRRYNNIRRLRSIRRRRLRSICGKRPEKFCRRRYSKK